MKKYFLILWLLLAVSSQITVGQRAAKTANGLQSDKTIDVPIVTKTLANGLEVIVLRDQSVPLVTVEMAVRNGSFTEPPELNGLSHLFEHMFFKTNDAITRVRAGHPQPQDIYLRDIGNLGITYNGSTREEVVNYYFTTTSQYLPVAMNVIKDAVRYPTFDEDEFAKEKQVVIGEIDRNESNPFFYLSRAINDKLFYKYPTRKNPLGTRETVATATTAKMRLIQSRYYVPNNSAVVVTGDVQPDEVFKTAEKMFGDWQRRAVDPFKEFPLVEHPPLAKSEGQIIQQPVENVFLTIGWQGPSVGKDNAATYAADVFSYILTQPDSRFQRKLVDSGLAQSVGIGYYTQRNVGPIQITLVTTPDKARAALKAVYAEIAQFDSPNYFTNDELESAKALLAASDLYDREKLSDYTHTLSFWWSTTGVDYYRGYQKNLRATTRADISRYLTTYILNKPHVGLALVSPEVQSNVKLTEDELIGK